MTEEQARAAVAGIGFVICAAIAALAWGRNAVDIVLAIAIVWLLWNRAQLLERVDQAWDTADQARGPIVPEQPSFPEVLQNPEEADMTRPTPHPRDEPTEPIEAQPATVPDAMPLAVHQALLEPVDAWEAKQDAEMREFMARLDAIASGK